MWKAPEPEESELYDRYFRRLITSLEDYVNELPKETPNNE